MTRLELVNQLIENQPAFHFTFIPRTVSIFGLRVWPSAIHPKPKTRNSKLFWYRRRDSNPHCLVPKTSASSRLGYAGVFVQSPASKVQSLRRDRLWTRDVGHWTGGWWLTSWRKVEESNPRDALLGLVFKTSCAPSRATFPSLAGTPGFEPGISGLESDGLPLAYAPRIPDACGRTRTYEGQ
jgi:hypothetical protein